MTIHHSLDSNQDLADLLDILGDETPSIASNLAVALATATAGVPVYPVNPDHGHRTPLIRAPYDRASTDAAQIRQWWKEHPNALPYMVLRGRWSVLDIDMKDGKDGWAALKAAGIHVDSALQVTTPSGGHHLYFQHDAATGDKYAHLPEGVEIKSHGTAAPGARYPDGRCYRLVRGNLSSKVYPLPTKLRAPPKPEREPVETIENLSEDQKAELETKFAAKLAKFEGLTDDRKSLLNQAAMMAGGCHGAITYDDAWERCTAAYEASYVAHPARTQLRGRALKDWFDRAWNDGLSKPLDVEPSRYYADEFDDLAPLPDTTPSRLTFLSPADCEAAPSRGYLIKGLFAPRDVACIFGAPGAGKSLLAPHLGYAVARGAETFGMRCKQETVFYVAAEDPHGMRGRVKALRNVYGDAPAFHLVEGVSDLLAEKSPDLAALVAAVKDRKPSLIFIDTLAMSFPGLEENDAKAMGRVVAVARRLTTWGAAVVLIHHDTKAEGSTPRGHSLLNGALDVALHVKRDENGVIRGKLTKNRNGTCDRDIAFKIAVEDGGIDEDGDTVTLPRCSELMGVPRNEDSRLPASVKAALDILKSLGGEATEKTWRDACAEGRTVSAADDRESRVKAFKRAAERLLRGDRLTFANGFYRIPDAFDDWED